jgi:hypothetical protein
MHQRDAAPARGAAGVAVLEVEIAQRQRDDGEARFGHEVHGAVSASLPSCTASEQQCPHTTLPSKPVFSTTCAIWRSVATDGVAGLVDMEIDAEPALRAMAKQAFKAGFKIGAG